MRKNLWLHAILVTGFLLRAFGIDWDNGFHLHPDERMLVMVADKVNFFQNLNPDFFNYGSLPIYLLKGVAQLFDYFFITNYANYYGLLYIGRTLSVLTDTATIFLVFKIAEMLFKNRITALAAGFVYAISFFPIQNSNFFVVDVYLTFLATALIYLLLRYFHERDLKQILLLGLVTGAAIATKVTALIFAGYVGFTIIALTWIRNNKNEKEQDPFRNLGYAAAYGVTAIICFLLFMPYAFILYDRFLRDILLQSRMNSDAYIFPYTLQYVGTLPYLYYLKNIFFWGMGPILSIVTIVGIVSLIRTSSRSNQIATLALAMTVGFYLLYFLIIGRSAVKFMRYMLPLYPFFAVCAGYGLHKIFNLQLSIFKRRSLGVITVVLALIWTLSFANIHTQQHTRITATAWILLNIPAGKTIAVEHWDDRLPLTNSEQYNIVELPLYDLPDDSVKWTQMNEKLKRSDYIVISSNRLYVPLQKLTDCTKYLKCYPQTAQYYKDLLAGKRGFKKVAEFTNYPSLGKNGSGRLNDDSADESFTVYDHPKVLIFKKM